MKHRLRKFPIFFLAAFFLLESWLWDVTGRFVAFAVGWISIEHYKRRFAKWIANFSPWLTLTVFAIPVLILLPFKFLALWLLAHGYVWAGLGMILLAKLAGLGVSSFLFLLCKPKLLQLRGVRWLYEACVRLRGRAHALVAPYTEPLRAAIRQLRARFPRSKLLVKLRARMHRFRKPRAQNS